MGNPVMRYGWAVCAVVIGGVVQPVPTGHADGCYEDQPCWSCVDMGNRVCGPDNADHVPAGCYDDGGVLWSEWPCEAWKPSDGYRHAYPVWTI